MLVNDTYEPAHGKLELVWQTPDGQDASIRVGAISRSPHWDRPATT